MSIDQLYLKGFKEGPQLAKTYFPNFAYKRESLLCYIMSKGFSPFIMNVYENLGEDTATKLMNTMGDLNKSQVNYIQQFAKFIVKYKLNET